MDNETIAAAAAPTNTCNYACQNGVWTFAGGNPAPGFFCPQSAGFCNSPGATKTIPALPNPPDNQTVDANAAQES